jgi:hypothetical protein
MRIRRDKGTATPEAITAQVIKDRYTAALKDTRAETHEYWLNHSYLLGEQWLWFNPVTNRLDQFPRDPERFQVTVDRLGTATRAIIAKATSRELHFDVPPTQADDATVRGAKISEALLNELHREHEWEGKREDSILSAWKGGTSIIAVDWDPEAGRPIPEDDDSDIPLAEGDTVESVLSIVDAAVQPGVTDARRAHWWVRAQVLPPEQVQSQFHLDTKPAADATAGMSPFQQKLVTSHASKGAETADLTLVLTYYERPNFLRPEGVVAVVVGDKLVDGPKPWYFPFTDHLNFAVIRETRSTHRWTGTTILSTARPVQTAYNAAWSSILEHMKLTGNARLIVPQSAVDILDVMSDLPGEILPYPDGTANPPEWISPPQMPGWVIQQPEMLRQEIDDILGYHDISRGEAPANIESGYGLSILAENDATPLGKLVKESAIAWGQVATMDLQLYAHFAKEPREAKVLVPGQAPESTKFTGEDLMGQTTAEVPMDAVLPRSRAAMQAFADNALQKGLIQNLAQYVRVAEFPGQEDLITAVAPDVSRARRENHALALGKPTEPEDFDDHGIHTQEHNDFRKSARFAMLDEETRQMFALHIKGHETLAAQAAGRTVAQGQVSTGLAATTNADGSPSLPPEAAGALPQGTNPDLGLPAMPGGPIPGQQDEQTPDLFPQTYFDPSQAAVPLA